jgi:hypothetical protein
MGAINKLKLFIKAKIRDDWNHMQACMEASM